MEHIDEHLLELYIMGSGEILQDDRVGIEAHLAACNGCRMLADEMIAFHADLNIEIHRVSPDAENEKALTRASSFPPTLWNDPERFPVRHLPPQKLFPGNIGMFARSHPIVVGVGTTLAAVLLMVVSAITIRSFSKDTNPAYVHENPASNFIEIYNRGDELLWRLPARDLASSRVNDMNLGLHSTQIADLNNDGIAEVITQTSLDSDRGEKTQALRVFDSQKRILWSKTFDSPVRYYGRVYSPQFNVHSFVVVRSPEAGKKEIIASLGNGRSPDRIVRLDANGNELGECWHFGTLASMYVADLDQNGKDEVVLLGTNDISDTTHDEYGVIVILDPEKLVGKKRSTIAPGFECQPSDAERYYIRIPSSDMNILLHKKLRPFRFQQLDPNAVIVYTSSSAEDTSPFPAFDFYFGAHMVARAVKSGDGTDKLHDQLVKQAKLTGTLDDAYLTNLRNGISYWDGHGWRREAVMVNHLELGASR